MPISSLKTVFIIFLLETNIVSFNPPTAEKKIYLQLRNQLKPNTFTTNPLTLKTQSTDLINLLNKETNEYDTRFLARKTKIFKTSINNSNFYILLFIYIFFSLHDYTKKHWTDSLMPGSNIIFPRDTAIPWIILSKIISCFPFWKKKLEFHSSSVKIKNEISYKQNVDFRLQGK